MEGMAPVQRKVTATSKASSVGSPVGVGKQSPRTEITLFMMQDMLFTPDRMLAPINTCSSSFLSSLSDLFSSLFG